MRSRQILFVVALALPACSAGASSTPLEAQPAAASSPSTPAGEESTPARPSAGAVSSDADASPETVAASDVASSVVISIDTQPLPVDVTNALRSGGGELAATSDWTTRFPTLGLPVLDGTAVHLVEATLAASRTSAGWQRTDELQWLFSTKSTTRDAILDDLAGAAALDHGWSREETVSVIDTAECVQHTYLSDVSSTRWTLQGCEYPQFAGMVAIGISRVAALDDTGAPPFVDPSVGAVVAALNATINAVTATFGPPATATSTSTLLIDTDVTAAVGSPAVVLRDGELASWASEDAEGGAVVFTGSPGAHWVVTGNSVRFTSEGRLAP